MIRKIETQRQRYMKIIGQKDEDTETRINT